MSKKRAAKAKAARGVRHLPAKTLTAKNARDVKGGGKAKIVPKAGKGQQEFLIVKMNDVIITGVT